MFTVQFYRDAQETRGGERLRGKAAKRLIAEGELRRLLQAPPAVSGSANQERLETGAWLRGSPSLYAVGRRRGGSFAGTLETQTGGGAKGKKATHADLHTRAATPSKRQLPRPLVSLPIVW